MGHVIPRSHFTRASRERLSKLICALVERMGQFGPESREFRVNEIEIGRLIHREAGFSYTLAEIPPAMQCAPWLYVIGKLCEEFPEQFGTYRQSLRDCVEFFIQNQQAPQTAGARREP